MIKGSKKQLLDLIKRKGIVAIDTAAEHSGLAKTTLREHFLQLERDGYVEKTYKREGPGRPSLQYELSAKGHQLYPSGEAQLTREFIRFLKEEGEEEMIKTFFERFWEDRYRKAQKRMDEYGLEQKSERLNALLKMLEEEGFMPQFEHDTENRCMKIKECNCPFRDVIKETKLPCKLEAEFYKKIFGKESERISFIAEGDYSCTYRVMNER